MSLAFVFVNCTLDTAANVEKAVANVEGVLETYSTTGIYDLVLKVQAADEIKLQDVIKGIKGIQGVASTLTSIIYKGKGLPMDKITV